MATIKDVAREAGVSIATVSYVINGTRSVSPETRRRVLEAVRRLNYRPSIVARSLQTGRTHLIGYSWRPLPPEQGSPILDRFIHALGRAAYRAGYHLLAFPTPDVEREIEIYEELVEMGRVDGIVLSATNRDDRRVAYLRQTGFPFAAFGRAGAEWDYPWTDVDGSAGVAKAVHHLHEMGHRRIAMLAWPEDSLAGHYRYRGYLQGLADVGLEFDPELVVRVEHAEAEGRRGLAHLMALPPARRPTALICVSDLIAVGAMNEALDRGLPVGRRFGIVGFDDIPLARYLRPPLTTIRQPVDLIGEAVVEQLVALIEGEPLDDARRHRLLEPELVVRASTTADPP